MRSPVTLLFPRLNRPRDLSHSSNSFFSRPLAILMTLIWSLSNSLMTLLCCSGQNCTQDLRPPQLRTELDNPLPCPAGDAGSGAPQDRVVSSGCQGTANSCSTCHRPGPPGPFPQHCSPASHSQPIHTTRVPPSQVQNPAHGLVKVCIVGDCPSLQFIEVSGAKGTNSPSQFCHQQTQYSFEQLITCQLVSSEGH